MPRRRAAAAGCSSARGRARASVAVRPRAGRRVESCARRGSETSCRRARMPPDGDPIAHDVRAELQVLLDGEVAQHAASFGDERDPSPHERLGCAPRDVLAVEEHAPADRLELPGDRAQGRRLARAVRAHQARRSRPAARRGRPRTAPAVGRSPSTGPRRAGGHGRRAHSRAPPGRGRGAPEERRDHLRLRRHDSRSALGDERHRTRGSTRSRRRERRAEHGAR